MASKQVVSGKSHRMVFITCETLTQARRIAHETINARLASCANIHLGPIESVYRWKGKVESAREVLLVLKTAQNKLAALEAKVSQVHSYEVPEFIAVPIVAGSRDYLAWLSKNIRAARTSTRA